MARELDQSGGRTAVECSLKQRAQEEVERLMTRIRLAETDNRQLQQDVRKWRLAADCFKDSAAKTSQGVGEVFSLLEKLKLELPCLSEDQGYMAS